MFTTLYLDIEDPHDCVTVGEAEFCYYIHLNRRFGQAEEFCKTKRGHLASINSAAEQAAVYTLIKSVAGGTDYVHIGYIDNQATDINWNWIDGKGGYTNWDTNNPKEGAIYLCGVIRKSNGKWHNSKCLHVNSFLCRIVSYDIHVVLI